MTVSLAESSISEFSRVLASKAPVPGGGSVSALAGALAADLMAMVCVLSIDRPAHESSQELLRATWTRAQALSASLRERVDSDAHAYNGVIHAYGMPKVTPEERKQRQAAVQAALKRAAESPLAIAGECLDVLRMSDALLGNFNPNAMSDLGVGCQLAKTGLDGAVLNVKINLRSIADQRFVAETRTVIEAYSEDASAINSRVTEFVNHNIDQGD